ncbi:MAG: hypothetical protein IT238_00115 [Bacteroidia bacterium]|nr:hypothetical protein [Bacteroidia bacterium]MCZ2249644.1 hypothetical protein [Bacteroidia bacterium]
MTMEKEKIKSSFSDKKILVIEGDFINSYMLKQYLEDDFKMLYARDSHEVVKIINEHCIDVVMLNTEYDSFGLSANDLIKYIKNNQKEKHIKLVALPGMGHENDSLLNQFDSSIKRPFEQKDLLECLDKVLRDE